MYEEDYILRIISLWGQAIRRALESLRIGNRSEALEFTEKAIGLALDTDPALALRLTPEGLVAYLGIGGAIDPRRARMLADALEARSHVLLALGRDSEADLDMARADAVREAAGITTALSDDAELYDLSEEADGPPGDEPTP